MNNTVNSDIQLLSHTAFYLLYSREVGILDVVMKVIVNEQFSKNYFT